MTFGQLITIARKKRGLQQKELAALIRKKNGDGGPISTPYLNDVEHNRRNPPSDFFLKQFAKHLQLELDVLFYFAERIPEDVRGRQVSEKKIIAAFSAFLRELGSR